MVFHEIMNSFSSPVLLSDCSEKQVLILLCGSQGRVICSLTRRYWCWQRSLKCELLLFSKVTQVFEFRLLQTFECLTNRPMLVTHPSHLQATRLQLGRLRNLVSIIPDRKSCCKGLERVACRKDRPWLMTMVI